MIFEFAVQNYGPIRQEPLRLAYDTDENKIKVGFSPFIDATHTDWSLAINDNQALVIAKQVLGQLRLASYDLNVPPANSLRLHDGIPTTVSLIFDIDNRIWEYVITIVKDDAAPQVVKDEHSDVIVLHEVLFWRDFAGDKHVELHRNQNRLAIAPHKGFFDLSRLGERWSYRPAPKHGTALSMFLTTLPNGSVTAINTFNAMQDFFHHKLYQLATKTKI